MPKKQDPFISFLSFDSTMLIRQQKALYELIHAHVKPDFKEEQADAPEQTPHLLDDDTITETFNGHFSHFFRQCCRHYQLCGQIKMKHHLAEDDNLKLAHETEELFEKLDSQFQKLSSAKLDKVIRNTGETIRAQYETWTDFLSGCYGRLMMEAGRLGIPIADSDKDELTVSESRAALRHRLISLKLSAFKENDILNIHDYCKHKMRIVINNAFHRNHQTDEAAQHEKYLKKMKKCFAEIRKEEENLNTSLNTALLALLNS